MRVGQDLMQYKASELWQKVQTFMPKGDSRQRCWGLEMKETTTINKIRVIAIIATNSNCVCNI